MPQPLDRNTRLSLLASLDPTFDDITVDDLTAGDITASGTLAVTGAATLRVVNVGGSTAGALDNVVIGASTAAAGTFTNLTARTNKLVVNSTGVAIRTINVGGSTAGALDNVVIGASTAAAATVTAFTASSSVVILSGLTSVDPSVAGQVYKNSTGQLLVSAG